MSLKILYRAWFFFLLLVFALVFFWLVNIEPEGELREFVLRFGYLGFFLVSVLGGFNLIFPSAHLVLIVPLLNAGLSAIVLIFIGALGVTLADALGYVLGASGGRAFEERIRNFKAYSQNIIEKHPRLAPLVLLFWASFVPLPNELWVIPAGIISFGPKKTLLITFVGNLVFSSITVGLGHILFIG